MQDEAMAGRMDYKNKKRKVRRHDQLQGVPLKGLIRQRK